MATIRRLRVAVQAVVAGAAINLATNSHPSLTNKVAGVAISNRSRVTANQVNKVIVSQVVVSVHLATARPARGAVVVVALAIQVVVADVAHASFLNS